MKNDRQRRILEIVEREPNRGNYFSISWISSQNPLAASISFMTSIAVSSP